MGGAWAANSTCGEDFKFRVKWDYSRTAFQQGKQAAYKSAENHKGKIQIPASDSLNSRAFSLGLWVKNEGCALNEAEGCQFVSSEDPNNEQKGKFENRILIEADNLVVDPCGNSDDQVSTPLPAPTLQTLNLTLVLLVR